jgi:excisionase family DNA binding protein
MNQPAQEAVHHEQVVGTVIDPPRGAAPQWPLLDRPDEVARLFDVSNSTIYNLVKAGKLDVIWVGRSMRITHESVTRFLGSGGSR